MGIDLQKRDLGNMRMNFYNYPKFWGMKKETRPSFRRPFVC